jgi:methylmalonyl-CoA/ethylmalonyl-CoA epimerase
VPFTVNRIGQIAIAVADVDRAETFYRDALGLRWLFRFGDLAFFDCCGVRLMIEKAADPVEIARASTLYFTSADIALGVRELEAKSVAFIDRPHLIAPMEDHDLWMAFFKDPDGHLLALMQEAPKGWKPEGQRES